MAAVSRQFQIDAPARVDSSFLANGLPAVAILPYSGLPQLDPGP